MPTVDRPGLSPAAAAYARPIRVLIYAAIGGRRRCAVTHEELGWAIRAVAGAGVGARIRRPVPTP